MNRRTDEVSALNPVVGADVGPIVISPIGVSDPGVLGRLEDAISRAFQCGTRTETFLTTIEFALDSKRRQYYSTAILERLEEMAPAGDLKVVGVVSVDLFIPILTHVYGEAQLGGKTCVVSTFRLREGISSGTPESSYLDRVAKEAVHELGHTFKLRHCPEQSCLMHYCRTIRDVDRKKESLCRYCQVLLEDEMKRLASQVREP